jgi:dCMP deaminase
MNKVIAIVGMCGSGKSTAADILSKKGYMYVRFGQITLDLLRERGLDVNEHNERSIREEVRSTHGMAAYAILNVPKINSFLVDSHVVADGLYSWSEYKILKERFGENLVIIAIYSSPKHRHERLVNRKLDPSDVSARNRPLSAELALSRDFSEIENVEKAGPIAMANYTLVNDGSINELNEKIREIINKVHGIYKRPSWDQYFIGLMKEVAKRGTCNRGRSGAVIVRDKRILCTGYVGSPIGSAHCDQVGHQMKSTVHEDGRISNHCVRTTHAEQNAICQAARLGISLEGSTLYCNMEPCSVCAKMVVNAGIKKVIANKKYHNSQDTMQIFSDAGIELHVITNTLEKYSNQ